MMFLEKLFHSLFHKNPIHKEKNSSLRDIDRSALETYSWWKNTYVYIRKNRVRTWKVIFLLAFISGVISATIWLVHIQVEKTSEASFQTNISMEVIKYKGCIADGVLSGYGGKTDETIALLERSECKYLHRAVETWLSHPNFTLVEKNLQKFTRKDFIFGMFLAEAINPTLKPYKGNGKTFDFSKMCKNGSYGFWGPDTCKADFSSVEYRNYLDHITKRAIDMGIQSFLFGQIMLQDGDTTSNSYAYQIVSSMRAYAQKQGKQIIIGAQTNVITNTSYLHIFDYIEGGVGINELGNIEEGECFSRWWDSEKGGWCWALLWHEKYASQAKNVILHLDWRGDPTDDMSIFARMDSDLRAKTLRNLYGFFREKEMGFLLPMLAVVAKNNDGGCYGPQEDFYSPNNMFGCKDEVNIQNIFASEGFSYESPLKQKILFNEASFVSQIVPQEMVAGQKYTISLSLKNSGTTTWTDGEKYALGSQSPQDNDLWGGRIFLDPEEKVLPGETKHFLFTITAPKESGEYMFQWRMVQEFKEWFGNFTTKTPIRVINLM
jgi:hypothetical protein